MKLLYSMSILMVVLTTLFQPPTVHSVGGFGVSGTFAGHEFKLTPGARSTASNVTVVFFNQYDIDIDVRLNTEGPAGVEFLNLQSEYTIPANRQLSLDVVVQLDEWITPGEYPLHVFAQVVPSIQPGITLIGSAGLQATLVVYGEAGTLEISVVSYNGDAFPGVIELFRVDETRLVSVAYTTVPLRDQFIAADYVVRAYYDSVMIAEEQITLTNLENIEVVLVAQTLVFDGFQVVPEFFNDDTRLSTTQVYFVLENYYRPVVDVRLVLEVQYEQSSVEEVEIMASSMVNSGNTTGRFTYYPIDGWRAGEYTFQILMYQFDDEHREQLGSSVAMTYLVPRDMIANPGLLEGRGNVFPLLLGAGAIALLGGITWIVFRFSKKTFNQPIHQGSAKTTTFSKPKK